jgi:hypothetical protein
MEEPIIREVLHGVLYRTGETKNRPGYYSTPPLVPLAKNSGPVSASLYCVAICLGISLAPSAGTENPG